MTHIRWRGVIARLRGAPGLLRWYLYLAGFGGVR